MKRIKTKDYDEMSKRACRKVIEAIERSDQPVLGLATGSTPEGLYDCLIEAYKKGHVHFGNVTTFNLDEYIGLSPDDENSYHYYMNEKFFKHVGLPTSQTNVPKGNTGDNKRACEDYEALIRDAGYVDLQILGIGENGHIAFNEPGTPFESRTQVVDLTESTKNANARFFDSIEDVPTKAITMGLKSIMESKEIVLLASGVKKADAMAKLIHGDVSEAFPASILRNHPNVTIIADEDALSKVRD
ncbi:MAG TPA: glucosamine-6-phosphate deaminase [Bacillota bacterium]|nr:glucosamine-6-phosphate deaminase [Bacillota bacterium]